MSAAPAILVTGGASGIGFAVVEAVLSEGWRAICADVSEHNLASAREKPGVTTITEVALSRPRVTRSRIAALTPGAMP